MVPNVVPHGQQVLLTAEVLQLREHPALPKFAEDLLDAMLCAQSWRRTLPEASPQLFSRARDGQRTGKNNCCRISEGRRETRAVSHCAWKWKSGGADSSTRSSRRSTWRRGRGRRAAGRQKTISNIDSRFLIFSTRFGNISQIRSDA